MSMETETVTEVELLGRATYSPEDNKLRMYPHTQLDQADRDRLKEMGFKWAPKQELYVAPMWTPGRYDMLVSMCGDVEDEDTTLAERAEAKAERLEALSERTEKAADSARESVRAIADGIPFGQPILVGHHSERRARKDAEKIQRGMDNAVKLWESSKYWADRADGALRNAKYKELPAVRARRIKGIEADRRKRLRDQQEAEQELKLWNTPGLNLDLARRIANRSTCRINCVKSPHGHYYSAYDVLSPDETRWATCPPMTVEQVVELANRQYPKTIARAQRWIDHYEMRLMYERAMLNDRAADCAVTRAVAGIEKPEKGGAVKSWKAPGHGEGWSIVKRVNKVSVGIERATSNNFDQKLRTYSSKVEFDEIKGVMSKAEVDQAIVEGRAVMTDGNVGFMLVGDVRQHRDPLAEAMPAPQDDKEKEEAFRALKQAAKVGVKVVSAPQLFPTPPAIAERMVELAEIENGMCVLEPSAGTGNLVQAVRDKHDTEVLAYEINHALCSGLRQRFQPFACHVEQGDFLEVEQKFTYRRILMNPPFENGSDIKHILRAMDWLEEGGRLVGICANGPRQQAQIMPLCTSWEELPSGTFEGTGVRTALFVIDK